MITPVLLSTSLKLQTALWWGWVALAVALAATNKANATIVTLKVFLKLISILLF